MFYGYSKLLYKPNTHTHRDTQNAYLNIPIITWYPHQRDVTQPKVFPFYVYIMSIHNWENLVTREQMLSFQIKPLYGRGVINRKPNRESQNGLPCGWSLSGFSFTWTVLLRTPCSCLKLESVYFTDDTGKRGLGVGCRWSSIAHALSFNNFSARSFLRKIYFRGDKGHL